MRFVLLPAFAAVLMMSGCGGGGDALLASAEPSSDVERAAVRPADESREEALATGTLRADPATGCLWLEGEDGQPTTELLLQGESYRVDFSSSPPSVLDDGAVVATVGEAVEVGGGHTDRVEGVEDCPVTAGTFFGYFDQAETAEARGETAIWNVDADQPPASDDKSFIALVQRLACASGETGEVLLPEVVERDNDVVVTFEVEMLPPGDYTCLDNKPVPYTVELSAPLAGRHLVDGACLSGDAATTSHCVDGAQRWPATPR